MIQATVLVSDDRFGKDYGVEEAVLSEAGMRLELLGDESDESFLKAARNADGILVNLRKLDERAIRGLGRCRVLSRYGVGYDNVDLAAASAAGIWVANVPDYSIEEVSDQALALLLACARLIVVKDRAVRSGQWNYRAGIRINRIAGSTLGIIGYGSIARRFHCKAAALGFGEVLVYDPFVAADAIEGAGAKKAELADLAAKSDYISVHAPLTPDTKHLVGAGLIGRMKPNATLINTSRGPLVDEMALAAALQSGKIRAAGLDVFETEPLPADSPLRGLDNAVLSDHCSYYSEEAIVELKEKAARNIVAALRDGKPLYPVNRNFVPRADIR